MGVRYGDFPCVEPTRILEQLQGDALDRLPVDHETLLRCNRFTCPLRAWPGTGRVLLRLEDYLKLEPDSGPYDLVFFDDSTRQPKRVKNLYAVRAKCVTPGWEDDPYSVYAVELADWRYFAQQKFAARAYNVLKAPGGDWIDETLNGASPWTWDELGEDLWNLLGRTEIWPGWQFFPDGVPNSWHFWQVPVIVALDAVATRLGCALRWDPFRDVLGIVTLGEYDEAFDGAVERLKQKDRRWDEYWQEPDKPRAPKKVRVLFRNLMAPATGNPYTAADTDFPDADVRAVAEADTYALVYDDLVATADNGADQTSRAAERVSDYGRLYSSWWPRLHRHYRGLAGPDDLFLGSQCGVLTMEDTGGGVVTIIDRGEWPPVEWGKYWHKVAEVLTEARCVGNDLQETLLTQFSPPFRVS